jgi:hypothetical protein
MVGTVIKVTAAALAIISLIVASKRVSKLEKQITQLELDVMMLIQNNNGLDN